MPVSIDDCRGERGEAMRERRWGEGLSRENERGRREWRGNERGREAT